MSRLLVPRLSTPAAGQALRELESELSAGSAPADLVRIDDPLAYANETGGQAASIEDVHRWRADVMARLQNQSTATAQDVARFSAHVGRSISEVIDPLPSDAGHNGVWAYLALRVFPDVLARRWPSSDDGKLSKDRWVGPQLGRDRNYLKVCWRNWRTFGDLLLQGHQLLGEDELVQFVERSTLARNPRLLRAAAKVVLGEGAPKNRMDFTRELTKRISWRSGSILLDLLTDQELEDMVKDLAAEVTIVPHEAPRRALEG